MRLGHAKAPLWRELSAVIASCDGGTVAQCRIIEVLGPADPIAY